MMQIDPTLANEAIYLLNHERKKDYGDFNKNLQTIATGWTEIFGITVQPEQVALAMAWLKIARTKNGYKRDSFVDAIAYLLMAEATTPKFDQYETR